MGRRPLLSVILVTPGRFEAIREAVEHVHRQDVRDRIEVVIVAPREVDVEPDRELLDDFAEWRVVEAGPLDQLGEAEAVGFRSARGRVVVYVEEHSFPEPGWAAALMSAHEGPWAAVGPAVLNGNPVNSVSIAACLLDFGAWPAAREAGPLPQLASHQTSYKRELLTEYGPRLGALMEIESILQSDLTANGHDLYFEPAARTRHLNVTRLRDFVRLEFTNCWAFGGVRAAQGGWTRGRRLAYVAGSPLIPFLRGWRMRDPLRKADLGALRTLRVLPALAAGLLAATAGEVTGYLLGVGNAPRRRLPFELDRRAYAAEGVRPGS